MQRDRQQHVDAAELRKNFRRRFRKRPCERLHAVVLQKVDQPAELAFKNTSAAGGVECGRMGAAKRASKTAMQRRIRFKRKTAMPTEIWRPGGKGGVKTPVADRR